MSWLTPEVAWGQAHRSLLDDAVPDVANLIEFHAKETGTARGRRRPDIQIVSRSAVVMTCAYWEAFCEDLAAEALRHLADHATAAADLPPALKRSIKAGLVSEAHELAIWDLADAGWRAVLRQRADLLSSNDDRSLNTPKTSQVKEFFHRNVGIRDITTSWRWHMNPPTKTTARLDDLVRLRGAVAHRGAPSGGVLKKHATDGLELVHRLAANSAEAVSEFLVAHTKVELPRIGPGQP
jgi:hypothetical protein